MVGGRVAQRIEVARATADMAPAFRVDTPGVVTQVQERRPLVRRRGRRVGRTSDVRLPGLADDTGLFVTALAGAPGVDTAYYAGPQATYAENRAKLLTA